MAEEKDKKTQKKEEPDKKEAPKKDSSAQPPKGEVFPKDKESSVKEPVEIQAVEVPEKFKKLVEQIGGLSVLDLAELIKILEKKFGVSAAVPMGVAVALQAGGGEGGAAPEKTSFNLELTAAGDQKINVIKAVREITGLGLKEAKDMVDGAPKILKEGLKKEEAQELKKKLEQVGAIVELK